MEKTHNEILIILFHQYEQSPNWSANFGHYNFGQL